RRGKRQPMKRAARFLVLGPLLWASACGSKTIGTDSTTQFWVTCDSDSECGAFSCICGRCTEACEVRSECSQQLAGAVCVQLEANQCGSRTPAAICQPGTVTERLGSTFTSEADAPAAEPG